MSDEPGHAACVLIAEDEPMIGRILEHKLTREGHDVIWVRRADDAEHAIRTQPVDVVLLDATLERDGVDVAVGLMTEGSLRAAAWLALVEQRDVDAQQRALSAGAAGLVVKPFKPTQVAAAVAAVLAARPAESVS